MKKKIESAEYALKNLKTLKELIFFDVKRAKPLCDEFDRYEGLDDKLNQAENGIDCLIDYLEHILNVADPPKTLRAEFQYDGKKYSVDLSHNDISHDYPDEDFCSWLIPLDPNHPKGKWAEINMEMDIDERGKWKRPLFTGYAAIFPSYEIMMDSGDTETNLPPVKFHRI